MEYVERMKRGQKMTTAHAMMGTAATTAAGHEGDGGNDGERNVGHGSDGGRDDKCDGGRDEHDDGRRSVKAFGSGQTRSGGH